jgi:hypothetical protein
MNSGKTFIALMSMSVPVLACAQSAELRRAAASISEADVRTRIGVIADDSMRGRNTPSPGLDNTARYIAGEFARLGLKPGGDSGRYLLSYPIVSKKLVPANSEVSFGEVRTTLSQGAALYVGATDAGTSGEIVLVGGTVNGDSLEVARLRDRVVIYVPPADASARMAALRRMVLAGPRGILVVAPDSLVAAHRAWQILPRTTVGDAERIPPVIYLRESVILAQSPDAARAIARVRSAAAPVMEPRPDWQGVIALRDTTLTAAAAPNVVGILEGSDPDLRNEYLVYSSHMDHVGAAGDPGAQCPPMGADMICNGADDDASGTAGVIELAEAFSARGARPKRSVIFLTVSGEEHGLWGSEWFVNHSPVPVAQMVANINIDMIGRNWADTIVAIGKEHSDLGRTLDRINADHPELGMTAIDDRWPAESFYTRSDHYNFAKKGVPVLFLFNGVHQDYHQASDSPDKIDAEKESRILQLLFYLGQEVANAKQRPQWLPESYRQIVTPEAATPGHP